MGYARFVTKDEQDSSTGESRFHVRLWDDSGERVFHNVAVGTRELVRMLDRTNEIVVDGLVAEAREKEEK